MSKEVNPSIYAAIHQPAVLEQDGNLADNWREWKTAFDCFLVASGKDAATEKEKCALFMHVIGKYGREILQEFDIEDKDRDNYTVLSKKFAEHCDPKKNVNYERHMFFETYQLDNSFEKFVGSLKIKSKSCEFGSLKNSLILTQVIRGLKDVQMKEKLLAKTTLTLEEATQWCRAAERAGQQANVCGTMRSEPVVRALAERADVDRLARAPRGPEPRAGAVAFATPPARGRQNWRGEMRGGPPTYMSYNRNGACGKCAFMHSNGDRCPAYFVKCFKCDRIGHFAKCCRIKFTRELVDGGSGEEDNCENNGELLLSDISIDAEDSSRELWNVFILVNGQEIKFKLDSGADASVISLDCYKQYGFNVMDLKNCTSILREISKKRLPVVGYFDAQMKHKNKTIIQKIYVLDVKCNNLLGLDACVNLNLITRVNELSFNNCTNDQSLFEGIGCLPNECNIQIDESVPPVVSATRKIPIKIRPRLKAELDKMVELEIIKKEESPTDWVSSIVVVEKPDKSLRVCLDPKNLNKAVKRSHFQLPTLDDISSNLVGAKYFSKCDAKNGFWMIKLNEKSSKLCTFSTPYGRYRFLRLPFGINCAPEIFHREMYNVFKMEGVEVYIDDILIYGRTKEEHDKRVEEVMKRALANGVKFNRKKCVFGVSEIKFLGHIFNEKGMKPDTDRVKAISAMPSPKEKKELERFLGVTNYLSRFIPRYSETSAPLRELLGKEIVFEWLQVHENAFKTLKNNITNAPVLRFYNPDEPVVISVDASSHGLGACLLQGGRPVAYAARTLTTTERRWAQIEKELLAVTFGCTRFHHYVYGHVKVIVETDHKPLETIFKKQLNETPARLQRLMLKLQHYNLELQYKPGKLLFIADTLSRAATEKGRDEDFSDDVTVHVNMLIENVEATPEMIQRLQEETQKDKILDSVCEYYFKGWPNNKADTENAVKPYWDVCSELHVVDGILFRNDRVVIPISLRKEMLRRIHEGHMGIEKCQRRARDVMWWPGMSAEVARVVEACETCQRHRDANMREPLMPHPVPNRPWEVLAADLFEFKNKQYLLVVDYYSKFVEIAMLSSLHSVNTIAALKNIFSRFGIPRKLVTDNGTQFSSEEFKSFSERWDFTHVISSPHYPRSNGLAERNVRTIKSLLIKASESGEDWQLALLNFRNTPVSGEKYSPAQLLMNRSLKTKLPVHKNSLLPKMIENEKVITERRNKIQKFKEIYDRGTRNLVPLKENEPVKIRTNRTWVNSTVVKQALGDRSYWVRTENGNVLRRNRQYLLKLPSHQSRFVNNKYYGDNRYANIDWEHVTNTGSNQAGSSSPCGTGVTSVGTHSSHSPQGSHLPLVPAMTTRSGRVVRPPRRFSFSDYT